MNARPILMHARSIQNLLAGRKVQTRRIVKPQPTGMYRRDWGIYSDPWPYFAIRNDVDHDQVRCPYGIPGDLLWVRESLGYDSEYGHFYSATAAGSLGNASGRTYLVSLFDGADEDANMPDRGVPSIHLPRRYSRLTLELTDVRVERVQDCSEADAIAEGIQRNEATNLWPGSQHPANGTPRQRESAVRAFEDLWNDTNGSGAWERNDLCWALTFKVHRANVDALLTKLSEHDSHLTKSPVGVA